MIIITKQIIKDIFIQDDVFQEYCEISGRDPQEVLNEVKEGKRKLDHLSFIATEDEASCEIRKIN